MRDLALWLNHPNWTRDGRSICGVTRLDSQITCMNVEDGRMTTIANAEDLGLAGGPWMGLDAQDRPLVVASERTASVFVLYWEAP